MKFLKILGIILVALLLILVIAYLAFPKSMHVEKSIVINTPVEKVFDNVVKFGNQIKWSPFAGKDSTMTYTIEGEDGTLDALYSWKGDPELTGEGNMKHTKIEPMKRIESDLKFTSPFESSSDVYIDLEEVDGGIKVTWGFSTDLPFPANVFVALQGVKKENEKLFEKGLDMLKELCEKEDVAVGDYEVEKIDFPLSNYITYEKTLKWDEIPAHFNEGFGKIMARMQEMGMEPVGMPCGIYSVWDEENKLTRLAAAIPVSEPVEMDGELGSKTLGPGRALMVDYFGAYDKSMPAYNAAFQYMEENGIEFNGVVLEQYLTDPGQEADTSKWHTKIYFILDAMDV
jgi:effector-binding domain-containing protein